MPSADPPVPTNLKEFNALFPDEGACVEYLFQLRWPNGFVCPKCGQGAVRAQIKRGLIRCPLDHQTSITAGTGLHRTRQSLWDWFYACYIVATSTPGVSALQLKKTLGMKSHSTPYMLLQKVRGALVDPERLPLRGEVEVNEAFVGGVEEGRPGRGAKDKAIIVVAIEVIRWEEVKNTAEGVKTVQRVKAGRARMKVVRNATADTLLPWIKVNVAKGSLIVTDGLSSYFGLKKQGYAHKVMIPVKGDATSYLPMSHLVVSNLKAWLLGTYHGAVEKKHLQAYLNEYVFRFNRRMWRGPAFLRCLKMLLHSDPVEYEDIYEGPPRYEHPNPDEAHVIATRMYTKADPGLRAWIEAHESQWLAAVDAGLRGGKE